MNATKRLIARAGLVGCSVMGVALTGCQTHVVHERTRTVYVPAPPPVVHAPTAPAPPPPVVHVPPAPTPQPPPVVVMAPPAQAPVVVIQSANDFYEPLAVHGRWVVVGSYGRCWIPAHVEVGWRPYSNGYWRRTDAGWYWVSEEPWGWATYHYGRWDWHAMHGWIWVPYTQWAPAWVCWREGGGYVGWAPLRPSVSINVSIGRVDYEPAFASRAFVFVEHRRMLEPVRPKTVIVNNTTIINKTVNITNVKVVNQTVINEGPRPEVIERASGRKVQPVPAREFRRREEAAVAARQRNVPTASERKAPPHAVTEPQPAPKQVEPPHHTQVVAKPAELQKPSVVVTPPARPLATPARPTPPLTEVREPARDENKPATETVKKTATLTTVAPRAKASVEPTQAVPFQRELRPAEKPMLTSKPVQQPVTPNPIRNGKKPDTAFVKKTTTTPPALAPEAKPEARPARVVPTQRQLRPVEKPAVVAKSAPQPVMRNSIRDEEKRETIIERKDPATPVTVEPKPRNEAAPQPKAEMKPALKVESVRPSPVRIQIASPAERPAARQLTSPSARAPVPAQAEAEKNKKHEDAPGSR